MYAKLFHSMLDGSLCTAGPWEALVTFQNMIILADRNGAVDITPEVISRRTLIPLEIITKGIEALSAPDPDSRNPNNDGRRIVPLRPHTTWGWKIVNFAHFHAERTNEERREYFRTYQRARRAKEAGNGKGTIKAKSVETHGFLAFWAAYPKRTARTAALKAWNALSPDGSLQAAILARVEASRSSPDWARDGGKYIPHPATYLNGRRWEDEIQAAPQKRFPI